MVCQTWKEQYCPVHGFTYVPMPRNPAEGQDAARGYVAKCPLRSCTYGQAVEPSTCLTVLEPGD